MIGQATGIELIDISMRKDKKCGKYLFTLTYHGTHDNGQIDEYILKDVENPFSVHSFEISRDEWCSTKLVLDKRKLNIIGNHSITCKTIKEPDPIEVTMDEIEKKYGCPVKIVKSKEGK